MNPFGIHPRDKKVIGVFAWMPLVCLITYIYHYFTLYHNGVPDSFYYNEMGDFVKIDTDIFVLMVIFFTVYLIMGFASLYLMKFYIINHIATRSKATKGIKTLWVIFLVLFGVIVAPIYYHAVIARSPGIWDENPPVFEFD